MYFTRQESEWNPELVTPIKGVWRLQKELLAVVTEVDEVPGAIITPSFLLGKKVYFQSLEGCQVLTENSLGYSCSGFYDGVIVAVFEHYLIVGKYYLVTVELNPQCHEIWASIMKDRGLTHSKEISDSGGLKLEQDRSDHDWLRYLKDMLGWW
jgi:hypothetical protein